MLEKGADPNLGGGRTQQGRFVYSPLNIVCRAGDPDLVAMLIRHGADPERGEGENIWTPLHLASSSEYPDVAKVLLENGVDPNAKDQNGRTPLYLVLDKYLVPGRYSSKNQNPFRATKDLGYSGSADFMRQKEPLILEVARISLENGASIDNELADGFLPIHFAAAKDDSRFLELFLEFKADPDTTNSVGITPLHVAAAKNAIDAVKTLAEAATDLNRPDKNGNTPLHYAAMTGDVLATQTLLELATNRDALNAKGQTPAEARAESPKTYGRIAPFGLPVYRQAIPTISDVLGE